MPEIKSKFSKEQIEKYAKENQLEVLNLSQITAKFMELEDRIGELQSVIDELSKDRLSPLKEVYTKAIEYLTKLKELESK